MFVRQEDVLLCVNQRILKVLKMQRLFPGCLCPIMSDYVLFLAVSFLSVPPLPPTSHTPLQEDVEFEREINKMRQ